MNLQPECFGCLISQVSTLLKERQLPAEEKVKILQKVSAIVSNLEPDSPPPVYGREIHTALKELLADDDPYFPHKKLSNDNALELFPLIEKEVKEASEPLSKAVQVAISGNIIDYGAPGSGDMGTIKESLSDALGIKLDSTAINLFKKDTVEAKKILYIGDNAGEIVFDRPLIELLGREKTVFAVRGEIILNDATRQDIEYTELFDGVSTIDTGDSTPGIAPERSSREFMAEFKSADVVILKGQGNFETLFGLDLSAWRKTTSPFYYLFKAKCGPVAEMTGLKTGSVAFLRQEQ